MAKFRKNHSKASASSSNGMMVKFGLFGAIVVGLIWGFNQFMGEGGDVNEAMEQAADILNGKAPSSKDNDGPGSPGIPTVPGNMLPTSTTGQIVNHEFYSLSYNEAHEQAEWVAYELTKESLIVPNVKRTGNFRPDPKVRKASASDRDYRGSGYDRGHMAPAGDMAFSETAMSQTFYMSNMSPQIRNFNGGIWRELEETVRDWAYKNRHLYVVTGPVLRGQMREQIGPNKVSVPDKYYKVILDYTKPGYKAIAFLMSNEISYQPIGKYAVTIDEVEEVTGIDFFPELLDEETEERLESQFDLEDWKFNGKKFQLRNDKWNKRRQN
ncbi:MAG: DNA/RNA non-specific endonuclease [Saprospiraceae bacterium]